MARVHSALQVEPGKDFVATSFIERVCRRGLAYLEAGYPVHFSGPAGTGKTTLALHLAGLLGRPVMLVYGDEEFGSSDLLGGDRGVVSKRVIDNFIRSVLKTEETVRSQWVDHRLTIACKSGYTLVYDEFSRSHAEANNALLSILQEGVLALPEGRGKANYLRVHPDFRAIFTSNPDEYAGVYTPQSALLDRMVTIRLANYDRDSEVEITRVKSGLAKGCAQKVVDLVRAVRDESQASARLSIRASIMMAQILRHRQGKLTPDDPVLLETCQDVLGSSLAADGRLQHIIERVLNGSASQPKEEKECESPSDPGASRTSSTTGKAACRSV